MVDKYELIIFCNGSEIYCKPVIDALEKNRKYFAHKLYGDFTLFQNIQFSVKFYEILLSGYTRSLKDLIIVDCHVGTFSLNMFNGIPISPYICTKISDKDNELPLLALYLDTLVSNKNINTEIRDHIAKIAFSKRSIHKKSSDSSENQYTE